MKSALLPTLNPLDHSVLEECSGRVLPPSKRHWLRRIEELDPVHDAQTIHHITALVEFPFDYQRSLEFALYRTYCVPSVSDLLDETGEFEHRPQKRYDDTALLMTELIQHGIDRGRGREALRTINRNHARYEISNEDFLYVLSTFIFEPLDWLDAYGYRRLHPHERIAAFEFYRQVGSRMGIDSIPGTLAEFRTWRDLYEEEHFARTETTVAVGGYTLGLMKAWFPAPAGPFVELGVNALLDDKMREAFGFDEPHRAFKVAMSTALRLRGRIVGLLPARRRGVDIDSEPNRTYPDFGPDFPVRDLGACPFHAPAPESRSDGGKGRVTADREVTTATPSGDAA
ncbi:oxygenase MpaB family protein [Dietzia sp.]|uniref:oxygenase MpaB family protein n=1 Tax=Dietzia sp. TaxID=1871616 RepID=UPI002FDAE3DA